MPGKGRGRPPKYPPGWTENQKQRARYAAGRTTAAELQLAKRLRRELDRPNVKDELFESLQRRGEKLKKSGIGLLCDKLVTLAFAGSLPAIREVMDRLYGKPAMSMALERKSGSSLAVESLRQMPREVAMEQLAAAAEQIAKLRQELLESDPVISHALAEASDALNPGPPAEESESMETDWDFSLITEKQSAKDDLAAVLTPQDIVVDGDHNQVD